MYRTLWGEKFKKRKKISLALDSNPRPRQCNIT